jgi:hypothetical protein
MANNTDRYDFMDLTFQCAIDDVETLGDMKDLPKVALSARLEVIRNRCEEQIERLKEADDE